jgi:hypothetical protein
MRKRCTVATLSQLSNRIQVFFQRPLAEKIVAPVIASVLTFVVTLSILHFLAPPGNETLTALMDQEITAARNRDIRIVSTIFDEKASVMDAGCKTPGQGKVWRGISELAARYSTLGTFPSLEHVVSAVAWVPDSWQANKAYVSASTTGSVINADGSLQVLEGDERWVFVKMDGQWRITSFSYNLCLSGP